jgi:signal transduction histidine kinase
MEGQVAVWLNVILSVLLVAGAMVAILFWVLGNGEGLLLTVAADIFFASLLLLVRRDRVRIASLLLMLLLLVFATLAAYTAGGVNAGTVTSYFFLLVLSALLLSENAMLAVALLSVLALWGLFYASASGAVPDDNLQGSFVKAILQSLMLVATAIALRFTMQWLHRALDLAQSSERALIQSNRELQREIAERGRIEEALRRYTARLELRNKELDAFAHTVAHDLDGSLAHIIGFAEALHQDLAELPQEEVHRHLKTISQSGRKMSGVIKDLLLLASMRQAEDMTLAPLNMARIVAEAQKRLADLIEERQAEIILPAEDAWPVAVGYAPWIEEVWYNYLSNALNHCGQPLRIELGAKVQAGAIPAVRFWIRDEGPGIPSQQQARLFKPLARFDQDEQQAGGHGLGLSIVRRIVEKLGGQVGVESEVGRGSLFWFTLPQYGALSTDQMQLEGGA